MKYSILIALLGSITLLPAFQCNKESADSYKARLEIKGMCMNYTIKVLDNSIDTSKIEAVWTDPSTNKTHTNVFGLLSWCSFPTDINEGDEFYFSIRESEDLNCATCLAYYPTPNKKLFIKVSKTPM